MADALQGVTFGAGLGVAAGLAYTPYVSLDRSDMAEILLTALAGDVMGTGLGLWLNASTGTRAALFEVGGLGGLALGTWGAMRHQFSGADMGLTSYGMLMGTWLGGWSPQLWNNPSGTDVGAGMLLGLGAGGVAAAWLSQGAHLPTPQVGDVVLSGMGAGATGAGLGLLLSTNDALWVGLMDGATLLGTGLAVALVPPPEAGKPGHPHSAGVGALAGVYGLYQGAGISGLLSATNRQLGGGMLFASAAGALLGTYLGDRLHLDTSEILVLLGGSAWGVWVGAWTAAVIANDLGHTPAGGSFVLGIGTTAVATDIALALTAFGVSRMGHLPPLRFAWISVAGGVGVMAGLSVASLANSDPEMGVLIGTVAGLLVGSVATAFTDFAPAHRTPTPDDSPQSTAPTHPWWPWVKEWTPSVQMVTDERWRILHPNAMPPMLVTVQGRLM